MDSSENIDELNNLIDSLIDNEIPIDTLSMNSKFFEDNLVLKINSLNCLKSLILSCPSLSNLSFLNHAKLENFEVISCPNLLKICSFDQLPNLSSLTISKCPALVGDLIDLSSSKSLKFLDVQLESGVLPSLNNLGLRHIILRNSNIDVSELNLLGSLQELEIIELWQCNIRGKLQMDHIQDWKHLEKLEILTLNYTLFPSGLLIGFFGSEVAKLLELNLEGCQIDHDILAQIGKMTSLKTLNLSHAIVLPDDLWHIASLIHLTKLCIPPNLEQRAKVIFVDLIQQGRLTLTIDKVDKRDQNECEIS
ncbi:MAG: hypothetical protein H0V82_03430 [Candidatus Protochlamydia sp.]|nr:hypothetical protein [Candidatus Protochlamydia sp.]